MFVGNLSFIKFSCEHQYAIIGTSIPVDENTFMEKFFIVGCPRSGTTMLQQALNRHSRIAIPPETKLFFSFFGHSRDCQTQHLERLEADLKIELPRLATRIGTVADSRAFYELMARRYVERLTGKDIVYFGEKTPEHTGHIHRIRRLFPQAKILVLYRDGRDVALSMTKMPWASPNLYVNFLVWLYYLRHVQKARRTSAKSMYFLRYEDVVANPEKVLGNLLTFLGLPYESAVVRGWGNREGIPEREYPWKGRALEKITAERAGAFHGELSLEQIAILERLGRCSLSFLGYRLVTDGRRPLPLALLGNISCSVAQFLNRLPWHSIVNECFGRSFLCCSRTRCTAFFQPLVVQSLFPRWLCRFGMAFAPFPRKTQRFQRLPAETTDERGG